MKSTENLPSRLQLIVSAEWYQMVPLHRYRHVATSSDKKRITLQLPKEATTNVITLCEDIRKRERVRTYRLNEK